MWQRVLYRQGYHLAALVLLLAAVAGAFRLPGVGQGSLWGVGSATWLAIAVGWTVAHQVWIVPVWRLQLENQWVTRRNARVGFGLYLVVFFIFLAGRLVLAILLGIANHATLPLPGWLGWLLAGVAALPTAFLGYSVVRFFGLARAAGGDHFLPAYREMPMASGGIYDYVDNGMYIFGMLVLWLPALLAGSMGGLVFAAFSHVYIWVHYYTLEKPDLQRIFGEG